MVSPELYLSTCLRFGLTKLFGPTTAGFPLATLLSSVIAGLVAGFVAGLEPRPRLKLFLNTGMMGGLSTFSTFSLETVTLLQNRKLLPAAGNALLNLSLSLAAVALGLFCARTLKKGATS